MIQNLDFNKLLNIAEQAGEAILKIYQTDFEVSYKDDKSPLTDADSAANEVIMEGLKALNLDIPIISEENKAIAYEERRHWNYCWIVDPLDGDGAPQLITVKSPQNGTVVIMGSRSHMNEDTEKFVEQQRSIYEKVEFIAAGSSLKLCKVAEGLANLYPRFAPTMEWDTAAGQAVVEAAGGQVLRHPEMTPLRYNKENLLNPYFLTTYQKD